MSFFNCNSIMTIVIFSFLISLKILSIEFLNIKKLQFCILGKKYINRDNKLQLFQLYCDHFKIRK